MIYAACGASGLGAVTASYLAAPGLVGVLGGCLAILMIAIAIVDAREFIIPDVLVLAALGLGLLHAVITQADEYPAAILSSTLRGIVIAFAFLSLRKAYLWLRRREGLGLGDVKLAAVAGVWLDWLAITIAIEIAAFTALTAIAILVMGGHRITGKTRIPFGCFFAPAIWLAWLLDYYILRTSVF